MFLSHCAPRLDATHGGGRAIAELLAGVALRHPVAIAYVRDFGEPAMDDTLRAVCDVVKEVPRALAPRGLSEKAFHRARILMSPFMGIPRWAAHLPLRRFSTCVQEVAAKWRPDIIQVEFSVMGIFLPALDRCPAPRALTHYMPGADAVAPTVEPATWWARAGCWMDRRAWSGFEPRVMRSVHAVVTLSDRDTALAIKSAGRTPVYKIPLGIMSPILPLDPVGARPPHLLFVGNYGHPPNRDAARYLSAVLLPLIRRHYPDVRLRLVGAKPERLQGIEGENIEIIGKVPDVTPYLDQAAVVLAPIRLGGGVRIKVLEALAAGKAVVASSLAVEGLDVRNGEQVLLADSDVKFAECVVRLLTSEKDRVALGHRARAWAVYNLNPERRRVAYEALYEQLIARA